MFNGDPVNPGLHIVKKIESTEKLPEKFPTFDELITMPREKIENESWSFAVGYAADITTRIKLIIDSAGSVLSEPDQEKLIDVLYNTLEGAKIFIENGRSFYGSSIGELFNTHIIAPIFDKMSDYDDVMDILKMNSVSELEKESRRLLAWKQSIEAEERGFYESIIDKIVNIINQQVDTYINSRFNL